MATLAYEVEESQEVSEKLQIIEELLALYVWHPSGCSFGHVGPFLVITKNEIREDQRSRACLSKHFLFNLWAIETAKQGDAAKVFMSSTCNF